MTKPFTVEGTRLELNLDAQRGEASVAVVHPDGTPVDGFRAEECDVMAQNRVRYPVSWRGKSNLRALLVQEVRLRITLRHANLYAFQVMPG